MIIKIDSVDRSDLIQWKSFQVEDNVNDQVNVCSFKMYSGDYTPNIGDEVEVLYNGNTIFGGTVYKINRETVSLDKELYEIKCYDYTFELKSQLVIEKYTDETINDIIDDLISNYSSGFTTNNVDADITVESIAFDHDTVVACLEKLSQLTNYYWYVDYDKDIHFFDEYSESADFKLTDTNGKYIYNSLKIKDDLSQIRNRVRIRGGTIVGDSRTEKFDGDGTKDTFSLANKFSSQPTVEVGGVAQDVGTEFLDQDSDYDCMWSYNQKYIRFTDGNVPGSGTNNIEVSGTPEIPIIVQVEDPSSIDEHGVKEFYKKDTSIESSDEAKEFAKAQLSSYSEEVTEGEFRTYEPGLTSGQRIKIESDLRGIDAWYVIQKVKISMHTNTEPIWNVQVATVRTLGIVRFLQELLTSRDVEERQDEILEKYYIDKQDIEVTETISLETEKEDHQSVEVEENIRKDPFTVVWVLAPYFPSDEDDEKRPFRLNLTSYLYG
ncbi:MAG: hypothetical protein ACOC5T_09865 [Elusimicrobiota bacterium]